MNRLNKDHRSKLQNADAPVIEKHAFTGLSSVVEDVRKQCLRGINQLISRLFDSCDDLFYNLSDKAKSNKEQTLYFDAMREIRLKRNSLQRDYLMRLSDALRKMASSSGLDANSFAINKLSIVANDDMEIDVALTNMSTRARSLYREQIYDMQVRFDTLLKDTDIAKEDNPLLPEIICRLFAEVCRTHLEVSVKSLIILLKHFERFVMMRMGHVYAEVNEYLIKAGVCPAIPRKINKQNTAQVKGKQGADSVKNTPKATQAKRDMPKKYNGIPLSNTGHQSLPLEAFKTLFDNIRSGSNAPEGFKAYSNKTGPFISLSQLADLLSQAQVLVDQDDQYDVEKPHLHDITSKLLNVQSPQHSRAVGKSEDDVINLVAMFFEFILDDSNIALKLRNQISRLQIPVLKLALHDRTFFSNQSHPARHLINTIAAIGVIHNDENDLNKDNIYRTIVDVVKTICHQYAFDDQIFAELSSQLEKIIEKERHRSVIIEKRTAQTAIGQSKVKAANKTARALLVKKLHHVALPGIARDFLIDSWLNVMIMTLLKSSEQSQEWSMAVQTVDDLIQCCQAGKSATLRQRSEQLRPDLLKRIGAGLGLLGNDENSVKKELDRVNAFIKSSLTKMATSISQQEAETSNIKNRILGSQEVGNKPRTAIARQQDESAEIGYKALQQAKKMKAHDWVKYKDTSKSDAVRCKLLTRIESTDAFLFVNRFGVKVFEKNSRELAYDIQQGRITVINSAPLFDRTLAKVFTRLKRATAEK